MRNMIIYELEADYSQLPRRRWARRGGSCARYAFRNALLPQLTGLALQLGVIVAGALVTEIVFAYPGLGYLILQAIQNQDFFLLQGAFLFIIIGVLVANFIIDIVYVMVDPRTRIGMARRVRHDRCSHPRSSRRPAARPRPAAARGAAGPLGRAREALYFALRNAKLARSGWPSVAGRAWPSLSSARCCDRPRPQRLRRPAGVAALGRVLVRHHHVRPGRLRPVRPRPARHVPGRAARRRAGGGHRDDDRVRRRLPGRARSTRCSTCSPTSSWCCPRWPCCSSHAYLGVRSVVVQAIFIGLTSWPWAARAIRAQTFSLRSRDFVDLARLSGMPHPQIICSEIAPNMSSYLFMTFILLFGGAILIAATLDFIGLGPTDGVSLGLMMNNAVRWSALHLGLWWWFVPPGAGITAIVGALYVMNVGLDEVFNPRLREIVSR